jgi:hypothetical protein
MVDGNISGFNLLARQDDKGVFSILLIALRFLISPNHLNFNNTGISLYFHFMLGLSLVKDLIFNMVSQMQVTICTTR